jgi:hypothetical protein
MCYNAFGLLAKSSLAQRPASDPRFSSPLMLVPAVKNKELGANIGAGYPEWRDPFKTKNRYENQIQYNKNISLFNDPSGGYIGRPCRIFLDCR